MTKALATISAALIATLALVATANAAPPYLKSTEYSSDHRANILHWPPDSPKFRPCVGKSQTLSAGAVLHGAYFVSETHLTDPDLREFYTVLPTSGTDNWEVCRSWNSGLKVYEVRSTLTGPGFSHSVLNELGRSHIYGDGNYEWGGRIVKYQPGITVPAGG
jgi:hypothetical protein